MANDPVFTPNSNAASASSAAASPQAITTAQRNALASPAAGQQIFNTDTGRLEVYNGSTWVSLAVGSIAPDKAGNLFAWYKADALALTDNAYFATWPDSSGNGHTLTSDTDVGTQPVYKANAIHGRPGVLFDGLNNRRTLVSPAFTLPQPFVVMAVVTAHSSDNLNICTNSTGAALVKMSNYLLAPWMFAGADLPTTALATIDAPYVMTGIYNGASSSMRINGSQIISGDVGAFGFVAEALHVGSLYGPALFWDGYISELAIFSALMNSSQVAPVETYLLSKYGLSAQAHE